MVTGLHKQLAGLALLALLGAPAALLADTQSIRKGAELTSAQIGHAFAHGCLGSVPARMAARAEVFETAFGFKQAYPGIDVGYSDPNGTISVTLDGNVLEMTCRMSISGGIAGDGADLYESLEAHLTDHLDGKVPDADYVNGGVSWTRATINAGYRLEFIEVKGAFVLALTAQT